MDEILYNGARPQADRAIDRHSWSDLLERFLFWWDGFRHNHRPSALLFLVMALVIGVATTIPTLYTRGYAVTVDGQELGIVADVTDIQASIARVEDRVSQITGAPYTLEADVSYELRTVERRQLTSLSGVESLLFSRVQAITPAYTLIVDGQVLGSTRDGAAVSDVLNGLKAPYVNSNTISTEFTRPVELRYDYVATADLVEASVFTPQLTSNSIEEATYTVAAGDTYIGIANRHEMTLDELMEMNPQATLNSLFPGDVLTVQRSVAWLPVQTVDRVTYQEAVPAPVEYVDDDTMYQGDTKVLDPGSEGSALITARVTYVDGLEQYRHITHTQSITAPTTKIVAKGTKERPKTMAKGYFIWPVRGTITSNYGYRSLFGSMNFHGGLDIACSYGTTVKAADGGKVIFAGWQGSYGKLVIIDHENGKTTYYAHNSSISVSAGQRVYQGQGIARVGATGVATGPHCHFEVRINGSRVNPRNYL